MRLLLDLGNTRLKWAWQTAPDGWLTHGALDWNDDIEPALLSGWAGLPQPTRVIAASVVDVARETQITAMIQRTFDIAVTWLRTPAQSCGVRNAYVEPHKLGVDRFLMMVAIHAAAHTPCVVVGVGTALTLDALTTDGQHLGGLIAPGPQLMQKSLSDATARVGPLHSGHLVELANNTPDAVMSGCWQAAAALVDRFASRVAVQLGTVPELVLSGGDAPALLPLLSQPARLSHNAVLRGLAVWANAQ